MSKKRLFAASQAYSKMLAEDREKEKVTISKTETVAEEQKIPLSMLDKALAQVSEEAKQHVELMDTVVPLSFVFEFIEWVQKMDLDLYKDGSWRISGHHTADNNSDLWKKFMEHKEKVK